MRSWYELGLDLVEPLNDQTRKTWWLATVEEKKYEGAWDPLKILFEEALEQQRDMMMENSAEMLWSLPRGNASKSSNHSGGTTPFNVQVNFNIPIFKGLIDVDVIDKWLNILEGYFLVHDFSNRETITFALLKAPTHVKDWWEAYYEEKDKSEPSLFLATPTWTYFWDAIKE